MTIASLPMMNPYAHLSQISERRKPSPVASLRQFLHLPGVISLGGGHPHHSLFPIGQLSFDLKTPGSSTITPRVIGEPLEGPMSSSTTPLAPVSLIPYLQYNNADGDPALLNVTRKLVSHLHNPPYPDWDIIMTPGGGDGVYKVLNLLSNPGEWVLCDEFSYPATLECCSSMGLKVQGVKMDEGGMDPESLRDVLSNWDSTKGRRPLVMYIVPGGQNPMGYTQSAERRKIIYDICCEYHICIIEDDPYSMLWMSDPAPSDTSEYLASLAPSYLSIDVKGRVLRIDSFSKLFFPGSRVGYITAHKGFIERLFRHSEISTLQPSGLSQAVILNALVGTPGQRGWGVEGWVQWCMELAQKYRKRRDDLCGFLSVLAESPEGRGRMSFEKPDCGMFLVVNILFFEHPRFKRGEKTTRQLMDDLFERCVKGCEKSQWMGVLVAPGNFFGVDEETRERASFVRLTYATATVEEMEVAVKRFGYALDGVWEA